MGSGIRSSRAAWKRAVRKWRWKPLAELPLAELVLRWRTWPTDLIEIDPLDPSEAALDRAVAAIFAGKVVAVPTDALYTLIADPFSVPAVRRVYSAKGREIQRALPLLVRDALMVEELAREISPRFRILSRRFWPGPLTLIMPASPAVPLRATGNTGRLAVRQARCRLTDELIARLNQPVIATSANISGLPTCRSGIEVFGIMDGRVDLVAGWRALRRDRSHHRGHHRA